MIRRQDKYTAALYCRLSVDDNLPGQSCSIETQKTLLTQFCKEKGFAIYDYYIDDGWSGTNFDRPDFKRMMQDIENGKVNLVIVKDLSRFGREYAQMGIILEHDFESENIRFIAVQNNIDTINGTDGIMLPLINVMNSNYARECSEKTIAAHTALAKAGKYIGSKAPFGYIKDPADRHHLVIDPEAADIVKMIFDMFCDGIGYVRITKILREKRILNPNAYFNQKNPDYYKSDYWRKDFDWHATSIRAIISNPVYLGHVVYGRTENKGFYNKKRIPKPESEWIIAKNMHEAIITQETWDTVQKLMKEKRRETKSGEIQMFAGLVKCANCGSALNVSRNRNGKYSGFSCWVYKNYGKERCTSHAIGWKALNEIVLDDINRNIRITKKAKRAYEESLLRLKEINQTKALAKAKRDFKAVNKRLAELEKIMSKLYEDNALGKINDEKYNAMSAKYDSEYAELINRQNSLSEQIEKSEEVYKSIDSFMDLISSHTELTELNARILNELIDKIVVHEKTVNPDGSISQRVDIYYKFIGCIDILRAA